MTLAGVSKVCVFVCDVRPRCPSLWGSALGGPGGRWRSTEPWWSKPERNPGRSSCTGLSSQWTAPTDRRVTTQVVRDVQIHYMDTPVYFSVPLVFVCKFSKGISKQMVRKKDANSSRIRNRSYCSCCIQDLQHALLSINLDLLERETREEERVSPQCFNKTLLITKISQ